MYRLIYKSKATSLIDKEAFRDILYRSVELNRINGVNGALLATKKEYLQFLEGDFESVNETFFRIVEDPRHTQIQLITFGPVDEAVFRNWRMRGLGIFDLNLELERQLKEKYGDEAGCLRIPMEIEAALSFARDVDMLTSQ